VVILSVQIDASERFVWTAAALFIFLACCQIPLYGVHHQSGADPLYWLRMMMASNRGSLMELGITPIVTASTIMQLVQGAGLIQVSMSTDEDRKLFNAAQKLISLLIIFFQALAYVMSGMYGSLAEIGAVNAILIVMQLCMTGLIIMVLDDLLQKGYGFGSAISLFIATNVCEQVVWDTFSPTTVNMGRGTEFHGAVIALFHMLLTRTNKLSAIRDALYRQNLPNLTGLAATLIVTIVVIFLQGWKVSINLKAKRNPAYRTTFDVKLFYTSNMPIILQSALVSQIYIFSELLYRRFGTNPLIRLIGTWSDDGMSRGSRPTGGLAYYIYAPNSFSGIVADPFQALLYLVFILTCCGALSYMWIWVSGQDPGKTAQRHEDQGLELARPRDKIKNLKDELAAIIPTAAIVGGMAIGALSFFSEIMGARGSGTGILLAVTIIYQYYETFTREGRGGAFNFGDMFGNAGKTM
jgi:protein transport protein SEC61 subunit alpha